MTRKILEPGLGMIREKYQLDIWESELAPPKEEIIKRGKDADALVTLLTDPIDAEVIDACKNLKVIAQYAVGFNNIDVEYATKKGIIVTNTPGVLTESTADFTWALLMSIARRTVEGDEYVRTGQWKVGWGPTILIGTDVFGKTLGIIGAGRIGRAVARRSKGFGMKVLYYTRTRTEEHDKLDEEIGSKQVDLETLLKESDYISLHVPLTSETRHMLGEKEFKMMKKTAILINTARGQVIDEKILIKALQEGWIAGAALDVFTVEPLPLDSPLIKMKNVVLAPHAGSASLETRSKMAKMVAENLILALEGKRPPNIVNPEVLGD